MRPVIGGVYLYGLVEIDIVDSFVQHVVKGITFVEQAHDAKGVTQIGGCLGLDPGKTHHVVFKPCFAVRATQIHEILVRIQFDPAHCRVFVRRGVNVHAGMAIIDLAVPKEFGKEPRKGLADHGDSLYGHGCVHGGIVVVVHKVAIFRYCCSFLILPKLPKQAIRGLAERIGTIDESALDHFPLPLIVVICWTMVLGFFRTVVFEPIGTPFGAAFVIVIVVLVLFRIELI
mmetsp:Transcript_483/g.1061  ORF Transcript_483/g.1061 Transcript_483/m.1061 type:complete len:230 (-) Transcript_483:1116-1805(-)